MKHDGVGIQVAKELRHRDLGVGVLVFEYQMLELSLLWQFRGASKVIVVDALGSGGYAGTVSTCTMAPREDSLFELPSLHALQLHDMFDLASQAAMLPCPVTIVSVEPKDCSPRESVTGDLTAAVPRAAEAVNEELTIPSGWMKRRKAPLTPSPSRIREAGAAHAAKVFARKPSVRTGRPSRGPRLWTMGVA